MISISDAFTQIGLLEHEDDVLEPFLLDEAQQIPGGLRPRVHDRENEKDKIRARNKTLGDGLVLGHHRVCARRVHHVEIAQKWNRQVALSELRRNLDRFFLGAVAKNVDPIGCRTNIHLRKFLAEKRVEQRRFAGFDFADDDKEQRLPDIRH